MKVRWDFGHFSRDMYSFGGERVDISPTSSLKLRAIVNEVIAVLKAESWQELEATQPKAARRIAVDFLRDRELRELTRAMAKDPRLAGWLPRSPH